MLDRTPNDIRNSRRWVSDIWRAASGEPDIKTLELYIVKLTGVAMIGFIFAAIFYWLIELNIGWLQAILGHTFLVSGIFASAVVVWCFVVLNVHAMANRSRPGHHDW